MYQRRRVAFCPLPDPALASVLSRLIAVDECVMAGSDMGKSHIPEDECVLRHTIAGQATMLLGDSTYDVGPASIDLFGAGLTYRQAVCRRPWSVRYLVLQGPWAAPLVALCTTGPTPVRHLHADASPLAGWIDETVALALDQAPGWDWRCAARIAAITAEVLADAQSARRSEGLASAVGALLDARPDQAFSTTLLARTLGLPLSTLAHRFSAETGTPLATWVRKRRLTRARMLLRQGLSVVAVAGRMGFSSPFQLSRAYTSWAGHPPSVDIGHIPAHPALFPG